MIASWRIRDSRVHRRIGDRFELDRSALERAINRPPNLMIVEGLARYDLGKLDNSFPQLRNGLSMSL